MAGLIRRACRADGSRARSGAHAAGSGLHALLTESMEGGQETMKKGWGLALPAGASCAQEYDTLKEIREQAKAGWHEPYTDKYGRETTVDIDIQSLAARLRRCSKRVFRNM